MMDEGRKLGGKDSPQPGLRVGFVVVSIVLISLAHYTTDTRFPVYHDVYRRLYYLPIFMSALWFGLRGGLGASLLCTLLYMPHILFQWKAQVALGLEKYLEVVLFNVVGAVTGVLAERLNHEKNLYQKTSERLAKAYRDLEQRGERLSHVEKELRRAEKVAALGELSATIAHEFMNPLGSIKGAVEILKDEIDTHHDKYAFLEILIKEIDRLDRTIRNVLRFQSQDMLSRRICNPNKLVETILALTELEREQRQIRVSRELSTEVEDMHLDPDKIQQVLLNVIINAIQAMPEGGRLSVGSVWRDNPPHWTESSTGEGHAGVVITVQDTGVGIPRDSLEKIFQSFYTTKDQGTGLGLTIVQKIARAHGGDVTLESIPGAGTRVSVWLPRYAS